MTNLQSTNLVYQLDYGPPTNAIGSMAITLNNTVGTTNIFITKNINVTNVLGVVAGQYTWKRERFPNLSGGTLYFSNNTPAILVGPLSTLANSNGLAVPNGKALIVVYEAYGTERTNYSNTIEQ